MVVKSCPISEQEIWIFACYYQVSLGKVHGFGHVKSFKSDNWEEHVCEVSIITFLLVGVTKLPS